MQEATVPLLLTWENFYVVVGSAAAALTGLMFVSVTLVASLHLQRSNQAVGAYGTPNVVHFCAALFIAALLSAPWSALWGVALQLGIVGIAGMTYIVIVVRRARLQTAYTPVLEDWLWHTIFPFICYMALLVTALLLLSNPAPALFILAAATVLFLFIGIHNAWDTVTYITLQYNPQENTEKDKQASK